MNIKVESIDDSADDFILERVSYDAAYGGERIIGNLFLPKNAKPPPPFPVRLNAARPRRIKYSLLDSERKYPLKACVTGSGNN